MSHDVVHQRRVPRIRDDVLLYFSDRNHLTIEGASIVADAVISALQAARTQPD
jgi:hypothetical protein